MSYATQAQIETTIPPQHLNDALDDDRDGTADSDILDTIIAKAGLAVESFVAAAYTVPFADPAPAAIREAAFIFACELIYDRRQILEKNPFKSRADAWRDRLEKIGAGKLPLDATVATGGGAETGTITRVPTRFNP